MPIVRAAALLLGLLSATLAHASAQRTFVATTGADTNTAFNCSLVKPCRGFAAAVGVTNTNGEIIALDSGGYGPVTLTKSVSIIAPSGVYAGISVFSGDGVTVNAPAATVVLRGLSINGQGGNRGIYLQAAARLRVENCVVSAMHVAGISDTAANAELVVQDTILRDNVGSGVNLFADLGSLVLDHVRSEHNGGNGVSLTPGVGSLGALATITDSVFTHNDGDGIGADSVSGATITLVVDHSVMSSNGQNGFRADASAGSGVVTVSRSAVNDNALNGISVGGSIAGAVSENVTHRNSGYGAFISGTSSYGVWITGNTLQGDLTGGVRVTNSGSQIFLSANAVRQVDCDNGAAAATFGNNAMGGVVSGAGGCGISTFGLK